MIRTLTLAAVLLGGCADLAVGLPPIVGPAPYASPGYGPPAYAVPAYPPHAYGPPVYLQSPPPPPAWGCQSYGWGHRSCYPMARGWH